MMDQNGRGKSDQITGAHNPINTRTGTPYWPRSAFEPCFSWNNVYTPTSTAYGFGLGSAVGQPTTKINVDYFNLGIGFAANSTPSQVSSTYTAALNGVAYTGTYVYPHPLVSGGGSPTPTPSGTPSFQRHLHKENKTKAKKAKKKKPGKRAQGNSANETRNAFLVEAISQMPHAVDTALGADQDTRLPTDANAPQGRGYNIC